MSAAAPTSPVLLEGWPLLKSLRALRRCYVKEQVRLLREHGDWIRYGRPLDFHVAFHPLALRHILVDKAPGWRKSNTYEKLLPIFGRGLATSEGERWKTSRRLIAPEFTREKVRASAPRIVAAGEALVQDWRVRVGDGAVIDVAPELLDVILAIVTSLFFGDEMQGDAGFVREKLSAWEHRFVRRVYSIFKLPDSWPTPDAVRTRAGVAAVDELIHRVIAKAENDPPKERNLLVRLLELRRDEPDAFSAQQLRDELMTLMLAGHDTTAVALTWACWLLARHPEIQQQAADEIGAVLRGAAPTAADVEKLPLTCRILDESMRLYPPVPGISRQPIEDDVVTGVPVAAGGRVELSLYATHRHPDFWSEPERFDPRRFEEDRRAQIDPFAYLPFSRGPRLCVGKDLALLEMPLLLAQILQAFRLETLTDEEPEPFAAITLRPKNGLPLRVTPRRAV